MPTTNTPDDLFSNEPTGELNQHLVDVLKQVLSEQDPSIDWSQVKFGGFGPDRFVGVEVTEDAETQAKLVAALEKLKPDADVDPEKLASA